MKNREESSENELHERYDESNDKKGGSENMNEHKNEKGDHEGRKDHEQGHQKKDHDHKEDKDHKHAERSKLHQMEEHLKNSAKESVIAECVKLHKHNDEMKVKLEAGEKEKEEYLDKYKRTLAELENQRKRMISEKESTLKYANFNIISDLAVILDDFERAVESGIQEANMTLEHFSDGVSMIEKQFADLLFKKYGVTKFGEKGEAFNPQKHLAMMAEEGDFEKETVVEVFTRGYALHDRIIRAAQVKVGKPKTNNDTTV